jgi:hypothetical protein
MVSNRSYITKKRVVYIYHPYKYNIFLIKVKIVLHPLQMLIGVMMRIAPQQNH